MLELTLSVRTEGYISSGTCCHLRLLHSQKYNTATLWCDYFYRGFLNVFFCKDFLTLCRLRSRSAKHTVGSFEKKNRVEPRWR